MFQKGGTKAVNRTEKFMKYTKNYIQSMKTVSNLSINVLSLLPHK